MKSICKCAASEVAPAIERRAADQAELWCRPPVAAGPKCARDPLGGVSPSLTPPGGHFRLLAIVPVAPASIGIRPIPAEIGSRARRDGSDRGNRDQGAEGDARNDRAIVGPPNPRPAIPIGAAGPAWGAAPGTAPSRPTAPCGAPAPARQELDLLNGAVGGEGLVEPSALTAGGTKAKEAGGQ